MGKKSKKKSTKYSEDDSFGSEPSESDESFGRKKKPKAKPKPTPKRKPAKKKPAKKKVKKKNVGSDDDSEDSDFETSARKKRHMPKPEGEDKPVAERKTRGVVINTTFADEDWRGG